METQRGHNIFSNELTYQLKKQRMLLPSIWSDNEQSQWCSARSLTNKIQHSYQESNECHFHKNARLPFAITINHGAFNFRINHSAFGILATFFPIACVFIVVITSAASSNAKFSTEQKQTPINCSSRAIKTRRNKQKPMHLFWFYSLWRWRLLANNITAIN